MAYMFEPRVARCRSRPTDNGRGPALVLLSLRTRIVISDSSRPTSSRPIALTQSVKPRQIPSIRDVPSLMRFMKVHNYCIFQINF